MRWVITAAAGLVGGIALALVCFAVTLTVLTAYTDSLLGGLAVLLVSPLYLLLYVVVFFKTILPAGIMTGIATAAVANRLRRPVAAAACTMTGAICGGCLGARFAAIVFNEKPGTIIVGGIGAAASLCLSGLVLYAILCRKNPVSPSD